MSVDPPSLGPIRCAHKAPATSHSVLGTGKSSLMHALTYLWQWQSAGLSQDQHTLTSAVSQFCSASFPPRRGEEQDREGRGYVEWIQQATARARLTMQSYGVEDWVSTQRKRRWTFVVKTLRRGDARGTSQMMLANLQGEPWNRDPTKGALMTSVPS